MSSSSSEPAGTAAGPAPAVPDGLGRVGTAMVTPFTTDGKLDLDGAQVLANYLVDNGTDMVVVNGTTGESPTVYGEEPWDLLRAVKDAVGDRAIVMSGSGTNDTTRTVEATRRAEAEGADAVLVVAPYYNRPDHRGMFTHFSSVAAATSLPVVIYDVPGRTAKPIEVRTMLDLAPIENIVGVKDATGDLGKAGDLAFALSKMDETFAVWSGADEINLSLLAMGAVGVISVAAHLVGPETAEMIEVFDTNPARARELHIACMPVHRALFAEPSPTPLKGVLNLLGLPAGPVRPPLVDASNEAVTRLSTALEPVRTARALPQEVRA